MEKDAGIGEGGGECKIYLTGGKFVAYTEISDPFKFVKTIVKTG